MILSDGKPNGEGMVGKNKSLAVFWLVMQLVDVRDVH